MNKYILRNATWWEVDEAAGTLTNYCGGYHYGKPTEEDEIVLAEQFADLDWTKTDIVNSDSHFGWIAPDGTFYGCEWGGHEDLACSIFGVEDSSELEKQGYIKIFLDPMDSIIDYYTEDCLTKAQRDVLLTKGVELHLYDQE